MSQDYTTTKALNEEKMICLNGQNKKKAVTKKTSTHVSTKHSNLDVLITTQLFDYYPYPLATTDAHFRFIKVNQAFCHFIGYSSEELLQAEMLDFCASEELDKCMNLLEQLQAKEIPSFLVPKTYLHKSGKRLPAITTVIGHFDDDGNYIGSTGTVLDLSLDFFKQSIFNTSNKVIAQASFGKFCNLELILSVFCQLSFRDFVTYLKEHYHELTDLDLKHCTFIRLGLNPKEVSKILHVGHDAVEKARYRLKKKLGLKKSNSLRDFVMEVDA